MKLKFISLIAVVAVMVMVLVMPAVSGEWLYHYDPAEQESQFSSNLGAFKYGLLYITDVSVVNDNYTDANAKKTGELKVGANLTLNKQASSQVDVDVTLYNSTENSFYYNKTETVSWSNESIEYSVSGIETEEEIAKKSFKTIRITYSFKGNNYSANELSSELHFNFVIDKDSIGDIVAISAVDHFHSILNSEATADSYQTLENAMNNRSGVNKASVVTYIGNVAGANTEDSNTIKGLFGDEFLSMDLDGDGNVEPITMIIKRENLDNNTATGDSYTYRSWGRDYTVEGVEMTIYITAENLSGVASGKSVVVYASTFTRLPGQTRWIELVPLTIGTASANNYSGYGSANSFNTDTWKSANNETIEDLVNK